MLQIQPDEFQSRMGDDDYVVIDVRTLAEVSEGFIQGMIHQDFFDQQNFIEFLEGLDKDKHYLMYCRSGNRSGQACMIMDQMGFKNTYNLLGGVLGWTGELSK